MKNRVLAGFGAVLLLGCQQTADQQAAGQQRQNPLQRIEVPDAPALGPYSSAVVHDDLIYLSGIVAFNAKTKSFAPANIEDQFAQSFANLEDVLAASGTDLAHVIKVTVYLKNPEDFAAMNPLYAKAFGDHKPARTTVPGVNWGRDDVLIELDVLAVQVK